MNLFKLRLVPSSELHIKCTFSIVNFQLPPGDDFIDLTNVRIWCTNIYLCDYVNEYIKENIEKDIKQRIIANGQTGGTSWRFKRFNHLNMHVSV